MSERWLLLAHIFEQAERPWTDRNGAVGESEWNSLPNTNPSPRKEFTSARGGNSSGESWRRNRIEDEGKHRITIDANSLVVVELT